MSSKPAERSWSLTRRMALRFAVTTCLIVLLYGVWSSYFVFDALRDELKQFMEHELDELALGIERSDRTRFSIERAIENVVLVTESPDCGFRVRDVDGTVIAEGGERDLLRKATRPLEEDPNWRRWFFTRQIAVDSRSMSEPPLRLEIVVDGEETINEILDYMWLAFLSFLGSVALAGLAGWFTAWRGLAGLREVVSQAHGIGAPSAETTIRVADAPKEVRDVATALNGMLDRIQSATHDIRTFTAGLAHELRSPLQNLIGETEVTLMSERSPGEYEHVLRSNLEDLHDLSGAIDNLVTYCRSSDPDRRELRTEFFDLAEEIGLRMEGIRRAAERAGVEIATHATGDTGLFADREGCLRVVKNLLGNAVANSPAGGRVDLIVAGEPESVRIVVEDVGPGVPEEIRERIFEPFFSGPPTGGRRAGYGLGLAICRSIVQEHGGSLDFAPRPGGGSRFRAVLPRRPP